MVRHRLVALTSGSVVLVALGLAAVVTPWALAVVPIAVVVGVAAWHGVGPRKTLDVLADTSPDAGSGPAGLTP